jgi:hypothetical protein
MPTICHLHRVRQGLGYGLAVSATPRSRMTIAIMG